MLTKLKKSDSRVREQDVYSSLTVTINTTKPYGEKRSICLLSFDLFPTDVELCQGLVALIMDNKSPLISKVTYEDRYRNFIDIEWEGISDSRTFLCLYAVSICITIDDTRHAARNYKKLNGIDISNSRLIVRTESKISKLREIALTYRDGVYVYTGEANKQSTLKSYHYTQKDKRFNTILPKGVVTFYVNGRRTNIMETPYINHSCIVEIYT